VSLLTVSQPRYSATPDFFCEKTGHLEVMIEIDSGRFPEYAASQFLGSSVAIFECAPSEARQVSATAGGNAADKTRRASTKRYQGWDSGLEVAVLVVKKQVFVA
jgi:hypothetical protein